MHNMLNLRVFKMGMVSIIIDKCVHNQGYEINIVECILLYKLLTATYLRRETLSRLSGLVMNTF
jgi:hypothetical protein